MLPWFKKILDRIQPLQQSQYSVLKTTEATHTSLLEIQNHLYEALQAAQKNREKKWADYVAKKLKSVRDMIQQHTEEVRAPDGLYYELQFEAPHLIKRVEQLIEQLEFIAVKAADLAASLEEIKEGDQQALKQIRPDAELMLAQLRNLISKENDIIYERFRDEGHVD